MSDDSPELPPNRDLDALISIIASHGEQGALGVEEQRQLLVRVLGKVAELVPDVVLQLRNTLGEESDKGCALTAGAFLESELGRLLRQFVVNDEKTADALLEGTGGLATFSSRIDMCYLLGMIGPVARRDLHLIRKIRNDFAHTAAPSSFETESAAARCRELSHAGQDERLSSRDRFMRATMGLAAAIHGALYKTDHRMSMKDLDTSDMTARLKKLEPLVDDALRNRGAAS
jgi:DNA-binding MltR family transcriptional regulator